MKWITTSLNEFTVFVLLEQERNQRLRDVYHRRCTSNDVLASRVTTKTEALPCSSPRYQMLDLSTEWFVKKLLTFKRLQTSKLELDWKTRLDRKSVLFIEDVTAALRTHFKDINSQEYCRSDSSHVTTSSSLAQSPSSSDKPIKDQRKSVSYDETEVRIRNDQKRSVYDQADVSDGEIRSLWDTLSLD